MNGGQAPGQRIFDFKKMVKIGPGIILAEPAVAKLINRFWVIGIFLFARIKTVKKLARINLFDTGLFRIFRPNIKALVPGFPGGNDAIKNMVAKFGTVNNIPRIAHAQSEFD